MNEKIYTFDENTLSDLHKDAHGFRPRSELFWDIWNKSDDDGKQAIWDDLVIDLEGTMADEAKAEQEALISFETFVARAMEFGAQDREAAIRWVLSSEGITNDDLLYGPTYICHHFGISYKLADMFQPFCDEARENYER